MVYVLVMVQKVKTIPDCQRKKYLVGVYSTYQKAVRAGELEVAWTHGEYEHAVSEFNLDVFSERKLQYFLKLLEG